MDNPLSRLSLDRWYKVFIAAGFAVFILVGTGVLKVFPILPTVLISLGFFFVGLGVPVSANSATGPGSTRPAAR